jgi:hypothetical protein
MAYVDVHSRPHKELSVSPTCLQMVTTVSYNLPLSLCDHKGGAKPHL